MYLRVIYLFPAFALFTAEIIFEDPPLCEDSRLTCVPMSSCTDRHVTKQKICNFQDNEAMVCCRILKPQPTTLPVNSTTNKPNISIPDGSVLPTDCGKRPTMFFNRIVGGEKVDAEAWPWLVVLYIDDEPQCAGSFINKYWILTASHCIFTDSAGRMLLSVDRLKIRRGVSNLTSTPAKFLFVSHIVPHPKYGGSAVSYANDVALIKLKLQTYPQDEKVIPICVPGSIIDPADPTRHNMTDRMAFVAGWGNTNQDSRKGSDVLLQTQLMIWSDRRCKAAFEKVIQLSNTTFCAGSKEGIKDTCQGDSGGPLMLPGLGDNQDRFYAIGIISFGIGCGNPSFPGAYTKTNLYRTWIEEKISSIQ